MFFLRGFLAMSFLVLLGTGCLDVSQRLSQSTPDVAVESAWVEVSRGLSRYTTRFATSSEAVVTVYRIDPALYRLRFSQAGSPRRMQDWLQFEPSVLLAANGVYFHEDFSPSGALVIDGRRVGNRQFDADKSGAIIFSDDVRLVDTKNELVDFATLTNAAQSYPFLVKDGGQAVLEDSGLQARRTFIGTDREGFVYLGVVPYEEVSLFHLSKLVMDIPVPWRHVLNLDGGPSTGLGVRLTGERSFETLTGVPNAILVEPKK